jgi:hypothetical protein
MASFTHYWKGETAEENQQLGLAGQELDHTAGNQFRARGVRPGDTVYIITFSDGDLRLIGRLKVGKIVGQAEAERVLQATVTLWQADEHVIAEPSASTKAQFDLVVKQPGTIEFVLADGSIASPKRNRGAIDPQSFRGVREIAPSTVATFEALLVHA